MNDDVLGAGLPPEGPPPPTWLEVFPWLGQALDPVNFAWWFQSVDEVGTHARDERLREISALTMVQLSHLTIGSLFPQLPTGLVVARIGLPPRAANVFAREGVLTTDDVRQLEISTILDWRNVGVTTIETMLYRLADISLSAAAQGLARYSFSDGRTYSNAAETSPAGWTVDLLDDLSLISNWFVSIGIADFQPLSHNAIPSWAPALIIDAYNRIQAIEVSDIAEARNSRTISSILGDAIAEMDDRSIEVLSRRLFADESETLEALGRRFEVTRERVRQIETKARSALEKVLSGNEFLTAALSAWTTLTGVIRPMHEVVQLVPALDTLVSGIDVPAWRALERISESVEVRDGWSAVPNMASALEATNTHLIKVVDDLGVASLRDVVALINSGPEQEDSTIRSWLSYCGYVIEGDFVLTRTNSVNDYAAGILRVQGRAMSAQDLVDRFVHARNASSLRNALATDGRFTRVDRDLWALRNWGMQGYTGIRSLIRDQISENSGQVRLSDLIDQISGKFSVSASSIAAYASAPPFEQRAGVVRIAEGEQEVRKRPHQTRRLMRRADGWAFRVVISKEHYRGSGSTAPKAIAGILGLQYGESIDLPSRLGPQAVFWTGTQPGFGTIRRFLLDLQVPEGSEAFLVIHDDGSFSFEPVDQLTGDPASDVLILVGAPVKRDESYIRTAVASAIGLSPHTPVSSVIGAYADRGDTDIADLLLNLRDRLEAKPIPSPTSVDDGPLVAEIMDLL